MSKVLVLVLSLVVVSCAKRPQVAHNFLLNKQQQRISWKFNKPVDMFIHKSFYNIDPDDPSVGEEYIKLVYKAASIWERRVGIRLFNIRESKNHKVQETDEVQADGDSVIYWMKSWDTNRKREQARTSTRWIGAEIIEADVSINNLHHALYDSGCLDNDNVVDKLCASEIGQEGNTKSKVHFVSLMIHELGHVLGQSHAEETVSVMQPVLRSIEIRDVISGIDADRIIIEYNI